MAADGGVGPSLLGWMLGWLWMGGSRSGAGQRPVQRPVRINKELSAMSTPPKRPAESLPLPAGPVPPPVVPVGRGRSSCSRADWERLAAEAAGVDLIALLERRGYTPIWKRKDGEKATFRVPWREDRHPSLGVYKRGSVWFWTDHARNETGTPIQALQRLDGVSRTEAILALAGRETTSPPRRRPPTSPAGETAGTAGSAGSTGSAGENPERRVKIAEARARYRQAWAEMTPERAARLADYWRTQGVPPAPGAVYLDLPAGGGLRPYVGIPVPTPEKVWGLECRLLDRGPEDRPWRSRTFGPKSLWVWWREPSDLLVTESILDALAGQALWPDSRETLVALNGVGQVVLLPEVIRQAAQAGRPIRRVRLALDADPAGEAATRQAQTLLAPLGVHVEDDRRWPAGVKDLHQWLRVRTAGAPAAGRAGPAASQAGDEQGMDGGHMEEDRWNGEW